MGNVTDSKGRGAPEVGIRRRKNLKNRRATIGGYCAKAQAAMTGRLTDEQFKKVRERLCVEEAAKLLGMQWDLGPDREGPDFMVTEGARRFGLEVSFAFAGPQSKRKGSDTKTAESRMQQRVDSCRRDFEGRSDVALRVQFVGDMSAENMTAVVPDLIAHDFRSKKVGYQTVIDRDEGLRIHATRALRPEWFCVNDRVGWVRRDAISCIRGVVEGKSVKLASYRAAIGPDVRLLIVADHRFNSGKMELKGGEVLDTKGFRAVYFYSRPLSVTVFNAAASQDPITQ